MIGNRLQVPSIPLPECLVQPLQHIGLRCLHPLFPSVTFVGGTKQILKPYRKTEQVFVPHGRLKIILFRILTAALDRQIQDIQMLPFVVFHDPELSFFHMTRIVLVDLALKILLTLQDLLLHILGAQPNGTDLLRVKTITPQSGFDHVFIQLFDGVGHTAGDDKHLIHRNRKLHRLIVFRNGDAERSVVVNTLYAGKLAAIVELVEHIVLVTVAVQTDVVQYLQLRHAAQALGVAEVVEIESAGRLVLRRMGKIHTLGLFHKDAGFGLVSADDRDGDGLCHQLGIAQQIGHHGHGAVTLVNVGLLRGSQAFVVYQSLGVGFVDHFGKLAQRVLRVRTDWHHVFEIRIAGDQKLLKSLDAFSLFAIIYPGVIQRILRRHRLAQQAVEQFGFLGILLRDLCHGVPQGFGVFGRIINGFFGEEALQGAAFSVTDAQGDAAAERLAHRGGLLTGNVHCLTAGCGHRLGQRPGMIGVEIAQRGHVLSQQLLDLAGDDTHILVLLRLHETAAGIQRRFVRVHNSAVALRIHGDVLPLVVPLVKRVGFFHQIVQCMQKRIVMRSCGGIFLNSSR